MRFEELDVWKRAARMSADFYKALEGSKHFSYKDQLTRSALSIASNTAEGYERDTPPDRIKFLTCAKGSRGELRTQLYIGIEAGYLTRDKALRWIEETRHLSAMLVRLIQAWSKKS